MEETKQKEEVDEKGVPVSNRLKEMERKFQEKYDRELAETRRELEELKALKETRNAPHTEDAAKAELMEFVKAPKEFFRSVVEETTMQRELANVRPWLESQRGYQRDDNDRLIAIENEYSLGHASPLERAKAAWKILNQEKLAAKAQSSDDERRREAEISKASPESGGKSASKQNTPTRADLIRRLQAAEAKGDLDASMQLMTLLEDVR